MDNRPSLIELDHKHLSEIVEIERLSQEQPWSKQAFLDCLKAHHHNLGVMRNEVLCGFLIFFQVLDEAQILNFSVHPAHRNQGIGQMLLDAALQRLSQLACSSVFLEVRASNKIAQHLYQSTGFEMVFKRKNYYKKENGFEDALLMSKRLLIRC